MAYRLTLPDLGEGIAEAEIVRWHVEPGQWVEEGDPLLDVETEKAIVEIPAPETGRVGRLEVDEGVRVPVGTLLVAIGDGAAPDPSPGDGDAPPPRSKASPRVRRLARDLDVDIDALASTAGGRPLTEAEVRAAADRAPAPSPGRRTPVRGVRGRLARHLTRVQREVPAVTVVEECDFTALDEALAGFERTAFVLQAVSMALADVPELNATFVDDEIAVHDRHDIGLAVQGTAGLVVPVVRDVESRARSALAEEVARVTAGVRENRLAPTELRDSTFTVTDAGPFGGLFATPLVNAPEVAVLGLHRVDERPVARAGETVIRRMGNVSCTFDHRAADGFHASAFLRRFIDLVQRPESLLADEGAPAAPSVDSALGRRLSALPESERVEVVRQLVCEHVAALTGQAGEIDPDAAFKDLGLDSLASVELRNRLAEASGLRLPSTLVFNHPTPAAVAERVLSEALGAPRPRPRATPTRSQLSATEPVAILGMACRYPGGVASPEDLWDLVASEGDAISPFPTDRGWDLDRLYDPDPNHPGTSYVREGGFLANVAGFDAEFFGISPREALAMDPQQRLLLETAWEALEDAGIDPLSLRESQSGVFAGVTAGGYGGGEGSPPELEGLRLSGNTTSVASGRLSYVLGLEGPAVTVDTACSSSLVALHLACQSLRAGECSLALAGGAAAMATPELFLEFSRQRGLAPDGRCKSFAAAADGTAWSEGAGMVVLERLSEARSARHPVLAVVRGSAINQDGESNGLTAPNGSSQERVISQALANAGVAAGQVDAVEAHGTGTALGDPIEAEALLATYGRERMAGPLWLGSIKSNIGHSAAAAGVAGVIKTVLAMRHGVLPRTLHVDAPTPHVEWSAGGVELLSEAREWPRGERPRRAGVSSFGISGTNAHLILEEAPEPPAARAEPGRGEREVEGEPASPPIPVPFLLSAKTEPALRERAEDLASHLEDQPDLSPTDVAYSLATTRPAFSHRAVALGAEREDFLGALVAISAGSASSHAIAAVARRGGLAFLFSGQGAQRVGMGRELHAAFPAFAAAFGAACERLDRWLDEPLGEIVFGSHPQAEALLDRTEFTQPALFALEIGLFRLLESWGFRPSHLIGHSIGELSAAHAAGVLSLEDASALVAARGRLMGDLPGGGAMVAIQASEEEVRGTLPGGLSIAAINEPGSTVVSGKADAALDLAEHWKRQGRRVTQLRVSHAFHSQRVEPMLERLEEVAGGLTLSPPAIPIVSNLTGEPLTEAQATSPGYWARQAREPVRFMDGIRHLADQGVAGFLELGPDGVLSAMARGCLAGDSRAIAAPLLRADRPEPETLLQALAGIHVHGAEFDREALFAGSGAKRVPLPTYPFQRKRFWVASRGGEEDPVAIGQAPAGHPMLGAALELADDEGADLVLTGRLSLATHPWLADHVIAGSVLFPGTAFLELALHAAERVGAEQVQELALLAPLLIPEQGAVQLQVSVAKPGERGVRQIAIHARPEAPAGETPSEWARHAQGSLSGEPLPEPEPLEPWPPPGSEPVAVENAYERLAELGCEYGPAFQGLSAAWRVGEEMYVEASLAEEHSREAARFVVHPALLDAALHLALLGAGPGAGVPVPFSFSAVRPGRGRGASRLRARIAPAGEGLAVQAADPAGALACSIASFASRPLDPGLLEDGPAQAGFLLALVWSEVELAGDEGSEAVEVFESQAGGDDDPVRAASARNAALLERLQGFLAGEGGAGERLAVLTGGAHAIGEGEAPEPAAAAAWGLVRSAQSEHPGRFVLIDTDATEASLAALPAAVASGEPQLALREGRALAPRAAAAGDSPDRLFPPPPPWRLEALGEGTLASLALLPDPGAGEPLGPTQVQIEMRAAGLNFRDVLIALGQYPGHASLGSEGAGVVVEVGAQVDDLAPGDRVMGLIERAFASRACAERSLLAPVPAGWDFRQAAATPIAFLTAHYGLVELAGLRGGERVLIHAGAGGVGMAAIQLARHLGGETFATASPGKWEALRELGLAEDHIASSRDLGFAEKFAGRDFDVVVNSLAGEFVDASLGLLGEGGRFLELGKADIRDPERLAAERPGVSYRAFDLFEAGAERLGEMLAEIVALLERGALRHPPIATWGIEQAPQAFRHLREGRNVGKLVLELSRPLDPGSTVLIVGGTGDIGAACARHLAERHGARHLLLASRGGPEAPGAAELRTELEALGAEIAVVACDVAERAQLADLLGSIPEERPLGAVVHAAGVLDDATIESLSPERLDRVFAPKAAAAWHLHELTQGLELSRFVMFSSASATLGAPGQGNYAAANAFLDALAHRRRAEGLPASSIAWGPWEQESGMTSHLDEADLARIRRLGIAPLSEQRGLALFDAALAANLPSSLALRLDFARLRAQARAGTLAPLLRGLVSAAVRRDGAAPQPAALVALEPAERELAVLDLVRRETAAVLGHDSTKAVEPESEFRDLGLDSLAAVELRNRLETATSLTLEAALAFYYPTSAELANYLLSELASNAPVSTDPIAAR